MKVPIRFRLRTLFVALTLTCVLCGWLASQWKIVRHRDELLLRLNGTVSSRSFPPCETVVNNGVPITYFKSGLVTPKNHEVSWIRRLLGDKSVPTLCFPASMSSDEIEPYKVAFPEAQTYQIPNHWQRGERITSLAPGLHFELDGDRLITQPD